MEEMYVNVENLVQEAREQIENDPAFIADCITATASIAGAADRRTAIRQMLNGKIKPVVDGIVARHLAMLAAESQSNLIH